MNAQPKILNSILTPRDYLLSIGLMPQQVDYVYTLFKEIEFCKERKIAVKLSDPTGKVIDTICDYFKLSRTRVFSANRKKELAECRFFIYHYLYTKNLGTLAFIGSIFSRDHTTVTHGIKRLSDLLYTDMELRFHKSKLDEKIEKIFSDTKLVEEKTESEKIKI